MQTYMRQPLYAVVTYVFKQLLCYELIPVMELGSSASTVEHWTVSQGRVLALPHPGTRPPVLWTGRMQVWTGIPVQQLVVDW